MEGVTSKLFSVEKQTKINLEEYGVKVNDDFKAK
jgi:hypothetical protein